MTDTDALLRRISVLEHELGLLRDREEIERLQYVYGYYIDNRMWREMGDLFAEEGASIEIGRRGNYRGKASVHTFLHEVLGQGRWGLEQNEFINHIQLQLLITVDPGGQRARSRGRALIQGNSPPGGPTMLWAEGLYENTYVKENGVWKIERIWWVPTFYVSMPGFESVSFESAPESESFPPDEPSGPIDEALGRAFPPFHYAHPMTGRQVPPPSARVENTQTAGN